MRFYTMPPRNVYHPFLLCNAADGKLNDWKWPALKKRKFEHAILDAGVEWFLKHPSVDEYPETFLERYTRLAQQLAAQFGERLWITIPDYIDDYHPGQVKDNVGKTLRNVERFHKIPGVLWLPVLQSKYLNRFSFCESVEMTRQLLGNEPPRLAIGTVCKVRNHQFIVDCCRIARAHFPKTWIHAFGPALNVVPKIAGVVDSFDSSAWTFPRGRGRSSARIREYPQFFEAYLSRMKELGIH